MAKYQDRPARGLAGSRAGAQPTTTSLPRRRETRDAVGMPALPAAFEQTSAIVVDGDRLVLCGRDSGRDELAILLADIVG